MKSALSVRRQFLACFGLLAGLLAPATSQAAQFDAALVQRGQYLAVAGDCIACHTAPGGKPFAGGLEMKMPIGTIYSTNITPDKTNGIGSYSFAQFDRAVRHGVAPGGKHLYPAMPYPSYVRVTPEDMHALYAYFMAGVKPEATPNRESSMVWPMTIRWPMAIWNWLFVRDTTFTPDPKQSAQWNRGAYLVEGLGHCGSCHTPRGLFFQEKALSAGGLNGDVYLSGSRVEHWFASNLRSDCMQTWTPQDIADLLQTGKTMHVVALGSMTEVIAHSTQHMQRDDLLAIGTFIHSLKATPTTAPNKPLPLTESGKRGETLYAQHCAACHQADGRGVPQAFPGLASNATVKCVDPLNTIRVILSGGSTVQTASAPTPMVMPPFGQTLDDQQIADIVTYIRATWGNSASGVDASQVHSVRQVVAN